VKESTTISIQLDPSVAGPAVNPVTPTPDPTPVDDGDDGDDTGTTDPLNP
jgi:hypothetical protein